VRSNRLFFVGLALTVGCAHEVQNLGDNTDEELTPRTDGGSGMQGPAPGPTDRPGDKAGAATPSPAPPPGGKGPPTGGTSDPFDPMSCSGAPMTIAQRNAFIAPGAAWGVVAAFHTALRSHACNTVSGCTAGWVDLATTQDPFWQRPVFACMERNGMSSLSRPAPTPPLETGWVVADASGVSLDMYTRWTSARQGYSCKVPTTTACSWGYTGRPPANDPDAYCSELDVGSTSYKAGDFTVTSHCLRAAFNGKTPIAADGSFQEMEFVVFASY
jgi:hypothetical protein